MHLTEKLYSVLLYFLILTSIFYLDKGATNSHLKSLVQTVMMLKDTACDIVFDIA